MVTEATNRCNKISFNIECYECGYPGSEALYSDDQPPLPCDSSDEKLNEYVNHFFKWGGVFPVRKLEIVK